MTEDAINKLIDVIINKIETADIKETLSILRVLHALINNPPKSPKSPKSPKREVKKENTVKKTIN